MSENNFPALRNAFELHEVSDLEIFRRQLQECVLHLLMNDLEKLRRILYRVDIPEVLARKAFEVLEPSLIANQLTELLINREIEKYNSRKSSSSGSKDWLDA